MSTSQPSLQPSLRTLVFHPGRQHSYETAIASARAGVLVAFVTSVYYGAGPFQTAGLAHLPCPPLRALDRWLRRRSHPALPPSLVQVIPWFHATELALRRLRVITGAGRYADLLADRWLAGRLGRFGATLVHAFEGAARHTLEAARAAGALAVLDVASAHEDFVQVAREEGEALDERWLAVETPLVQRERAAADYLLAASDVVRQCLLQHGVPARKIVQIPYGVDASRFSPAPRGAVREGLRVLYVGKINARKGVRYLLEAWRRLALPGAELVLVGPADSYGRRLLAAYRGTYQWRGNLSYHDVHRELQEADLFVCPSLAEGSPLVVYEAMAAGLPVVTTEPARAVLRDGIDGFVVPICDASAIADRIRWLHCHPRERAAMGASARQRILQGYTWQHYHQRLICAYRAMLAGADPSQALAELEEQWRSNAPPAGQPAERPA